VDGVGWSERRRAAQEAVVASALLIAGLVAVAALLWPHCSLLTAPGLDNDNECDWQTTPPLQLTHALSHSLSHNSRPTLDLPQVSVASKRMVEWKVVCLARPGVALVA